jgi:hypothetical protein
LGVVGEWGGMAGGGRPLWRGLASGTTVVIHRVYQG